MNQSVYGTHKKLGLQFSEVNLEYGPKYGPKYGYSKAQWVCMSRQNGYNSLTRAPIEILRPLFILQPLISWGFLLETHFMPEKAQIKGKNVVVEITQKL